ncbi:exodeoxyribonuclease VII large subunit [Flavihumibacter rivuli]|nr:exodeoxyribonuclease VII large subunit [Flavihumibacter rivuli]
MIKLTLEDAFARQSFWVVADVTSHNFYYQKGYHYFDLVEKDKRSNQILAKLSTTAWGTGSQRIKAFEQETGQRFTNDIQVLVKVAVEYHPVYGLKLNLLDIDARFTLGAIEQQRQATLERLLKECPQDVRRIGEQYHTSNQSLQLNKVIQYIAVLSSSSSAGYQDFIHTLSHNPYGYTFHAELFHTVVQGEFNAEAINMKLQQIRKSGRHYDAVVIIRGGGAQTDFLVFDQFPLAKTVAQFPIPVITGIGHQKNETIVDLMAHTATKTPTKAAELIIQHNASFEAELVTAQRDIIIKCQQLLHREARAVNTIHHNVINLSRDLLDNQRYSLGRLQQDLGTQARQLLFDNRSALNNAASLVSRKPLSMLAVEQQQIIHYKERLKLLMKQYLRNRKQDLEHRISLFRMASPEQIMKRGFALVKVDGKITANPDQIEPGQTISVILSATEIKAIVESKKLYDGPAIDL